MAESLKDKVAIVTGSTTGIGRGIAHTLAGRGCSVVLTGLLASDQEIPTLLQEFQAKYPGNFNFIPGDLLNTEKVENFCQKVLEIYPAGVDILVNNAGAIFRGSIEELSIEDWQKSLAINLTAPFILTKAFFPLMKKKGWGRIINMSSQLGLVATPGAVAYSTPKTALLGLTRVTALEGGKFGVTCNSICPGYVDAPMFHLKLNEDAAERGISLEQMKNEFAQTKSPTGRLVQIWEVAELVTFLCSEAAGNISGSPIPIDGANIVWNNE